MGYANSQKYIKEGTTKIIMRRIAIISSYAWIKVANNYGALLQYYALQQYLNRKGYYAFWIRFELYNTSLKNTIVGSFKKLLKAPLVYLYTCRCHRTFMRFCSDYLNMSEQTFSIYSDSKSYPMADYYITGSDQVWGGCQPECFLSFVSDNSKKIAYAASFGKDEITQDHLDIITPWVRQFAKVSVREDKGVEICRRMEVEAHHLLDPTLLIDEDAYPHRDRIFSRPYIFAYLLNLKSKEDIRWNELKEFSTSCDHELKLCVVQGTQYLFNHCDLVYPDPIEWLTMYKYSECIVTNTFHGTIFAIIHRKPFLCILQNGISANQNVRMKSLLNVLGLDERILSQHDNIKEAMKRPIYWDDVFSRLESWRLRTDTFFSFLS